MKKNKNLFSFFRQKSQQKKGAALIAVLAISTILLSFIQNVWINSRLEHSSSYQQLTELKLRYSARSGMEVSLLRLFIYKEADKMISSNKQVASLAKPYMDLIWSVPFIWPLPIPEDISDSDKKSLQDLTQKSFLKESYSISIYPEDGRLDVNDLSAPQDYLRKFTFNTLLNLLVLSLEKDSKLKDEYDVSDLQKILNNISDWTDTDNDSQNGGNEQSIEEGKNPFNRSFIHIEEIQEVPSVTKDIYEILKPHITVYGSKGLNLNYASQEIWLAFNVSEIVADEIRRYTTVGSSEYAPFKDLKTFCSYLTERDLALCEDFENEYGTLEMLQFNTASHFRIEGLASSRKMITYTESLIYDPLQAVENYKKSVSIQNGLSDKESKIQDFFQKPEKEKKEKKKPEKRLSLPESIAPLPFFIMYWKENL